MWPFVDFAKNAIDLVDLLVSCLVIPRLNLSDIPTLSMFGLSLELLKLRESSLEFTKFTQNKKLKKEIHRSCGK